MNDKLIYTKISAALADIKAIGKSKTNEQQGFDYRGIEDVYNCLKDIFAKHEIFTVPEVIDDNVEERTTRTGGRLIYRVLKIKYTVFASDGSFVTGVVIGEGMDSGDKAANKAMSVAHKYFLTQLFCIPFADISDPDADSHDPSSPAVEPFKPVEIFNVEERIERLKDCSTMEALASEFKDSWRVANKIGSDEDMEKLSLAKDRRKAEIEALGGSKNA